MSTAPEVIVAAHCGMEVLGFTLLSNMAAGILDQPLSEQEVLDAAEAAGKRSPPWCSAVWKGCERRGRHDPSVQPRRTAASPTI